MTNELRAFRRELATPSPAATVRARARLEAAIAAERAASTPPRPARRPRVAFAAALVAAVTVLSASAGLLGSGAGPETTPGRPAPDASPSATVGRAGPPDGLLLAAPAEGKDAGMRPGIDRGGWSECGTDGCYLL